MDEKSEPPKSFDELYGDLLWEALQTGKVELITNNRDVVTLDWTVSDYTISLDDKDWIT